MANETIKVYFKPMPDSSAFLGYHETLVYTDASGVVKVLSAYATNATYSPPNSSVGLADLTENYING